MYFKELPDVSYPSPLSDRRSDREYITIKNLFRRVKLRDDLIDQVTAFDKYEVRQGERPDIVAEEYYDNQDLDWLVLISNNITNVRDQWPLSDNELYNYSVEKYGVEGLSQVAYHETTEVKDDLGRLIFPAGIRVDSDFTIPNPDIFDTTLNPVRAISNYEAESRLNDEKRSIVLLRKNFVTQAILDLREELTYDKSSQKVNNKLIKEVEFFGNEKINKQIFSSLPFKISSKNEKLDKLVLDSKISTTETSKDSKGQVTSYRTTLIVKYSLFNEKKKLVEDRLFTKEFSYNSDENKFKFREYQRKVEKNLINGIVEKIIVYLSLK